MGAWPRGRWTPLPFRTRSGCRTPASCPPVTAAGARHWPGGAVSPALTGDPVFQVTSREPEFLTGPHWACLLRPYCFHWPPEKRAPLSSWDGLAHAHPGAVPRAALGGPLRWAGCRGPGLGAGGPGGPREGAGGRKRRARPLRRARSSDAGAAPPRPAVSAFSRGPCALSGLGAFRAGLLRSLAPHVGV